MGKIPGHPINSEGFYFPTIKSWNILVEEVTDKVNGNSAERGLPVPVFRGSVEDLENISCEHCQTDYIRRQFGGNGVLNVALIICPASLYNSEHPSEYWIEIWPDGNIKAGQRRNAIYDFTTEQRMENNHKFSDPMIKKTYAEKWLFSSEEQTRFEKEGPSFDLAHILIHEHK